ncbi:Rib/alpha-like domain-containing protein, partial [Staphylococcus felis]|uniref:Rib/alpha-like domain-containing protein n=1 Tax=Staphylococcus felis TaxID=46127 RepID=UPI001158E7B2
MPNDAQENTPGYDDGNTRPGDTVDTTETGDRQLPANTRIEIPQECVPSVCRVKVKPHNGTVTRRPPEKYEG